MHGQERVAMLKCRDVRMQSCLVVSLEASTVRHGRLRLNHPCTLTFRKLRALSDILHELALLLFNRSRTEGASPVGKMQLMCDPDCYVVDLPC